MLKISFEGEKEIIIEKIELPPFLSGNLITESADSAVIVHVRLSLNRTDMQGDRDGVIKIYTSSKRKELFVIPYLVLSH